MKTQQDRKLDAKVRGWMLKAHPEEKPMIGDFRTDVTFREVHDRMLGGEDFYEICECGESQQREYVFAELAERYGTEYDFFYYLWLFPSREELTAVFMDAMEAVRKSGAKLGRKHQRRWNAAQAAREAKAG